MSKIPDGNNYLDDELTLCYNLAWNNVKVFNNIEVKKWLVGWGLHILCSLGEKKLKASPVL